MMNKKSFPVTNIGSVSLLMVFIVLCLITFATLSLSGAVSDYHISQNIADRNTDYYRADSKAVLLLADIDEALKASYNENQESYFTAASMALGRINGLTSDFTKAEPELTYEVPLNDTHALKVVLALNPPNRLSSGYYRIASWQEISTSNWNGDNKLNLLQ